MMLNFPESKRTSRFFVVAEDARSIRCSVCGFVSQDLRDIATRYCARCRVYHEDRMLMVRLNEGLCTEFAVGEEWQRLKQAA